MNTPDPDYAGMARDLVAGTLNPEGFNHRAHVATAHELLGRHDVFEALALYANGLRKVTLAAGVPDKFNATVTFAFISLIAERMAEQGRADTGTFLDRNPDLLDMTVLDRHFTRREWASDLARAVPVLPHRAVAPAE